MTDRERHEFGCTAYVGRPCICETLRKERAGQVAPASWGLDLAHGPDRTGTQPPRHQPLHGDHPRPVLGCLSCEDALQEAREIQAERPWEDA